MASLQLMFDNCKLFNRTGSSICLFTTEMEMALKKEWEYYVDQSNSGEPENRDFPSFYFARGDMAAFKKMIVEENNDVKYEVGFCSDAVENTRQNVWLDICRSVGSGTIKQPQRTSDAHTGSCSVDHKKVANLEPEVSDRYEAC